MMKYGFRMPSDLLTAHVSIGIEGSILAFDEGAEQIFGHRAADVIGQPMAELIIPEELRQWHHAGMQRYLETGQEFVVGRTVELPALHADGSVFTIELSVVKTSDDPVVITGTIRPVSARE